MAADEPKPEDLKSVSSAWRTGDPRPRWEVLDALFEKIHFRQAPKDREWIDGYTPRMDRANRVRLLINSAFDACYDWSEREAIEPGAALLAVG